MIQRIFIMLALAFSVLPAAAESYSHREVRVFSNTGTATQWTVGEVRPTYGYDDYYYRERGPRYGGGITIGRDSGSTSTGIGFYFDSGDGYYDDRPYPHRPPRFRTPRGDYHQGYYDGYYDGARRPRTVINNGAIGIDSGDDRHQCSLNLRGTTYIGRAHFIDIAQNRAYENCANDRNDLADCRSRTIRCESIW
ncbi:MAG: hypothetical protein Q4G42_01045 [Neisseria sp.]|nr:hypothetical protein [Neisseria sp.]